MLHYLYSRPQKYIYVGGTKPVPGLKVTVIDKGLLIDWYLKLAS
jgi:hypothetical protein